MPAPSQATAPSGCGSTAALSRRARRPFARAISARCPGHLPQDELMDRRRSCCQAGRFLRERMPGKAPVALVGRRRRGGPPARRRRGARPVGPEVADVDDRVGQRRDARPADHVQRDGAGGRPGGLAVGHGEHPRPRPGDPDAHTVADDLDERPVRVKRGDDHRDATARGRGVLLREIPGQGRVRPLAAAGFGRASRTRPSTWASPRRPCSTGA